MRAWNVPCTSALPWLAPELVYSNIPSVHIPGEPGTRPVVPDDPLDPDNPDTDPEEQVPPPEVLPDDPPTLRYISANSTTVLELRPRTGIPITLMKLDAHYGEQYGMSFAEINAAYPLGNAHGFCAVLYLHELRELHVWTIPLNMFNRQVVIRTGHMDPREYGVQGVNKGSRYWTDQPDYIPLPGLPYLANGAVILYGWNNIPYNREWDQDRILVGDRTASAGFIETVRLSMIPFIAAHYVLDTTHFELPFIQEWRDFIT